MNFEDYQRKAQARAVYPDAGKGTNLYYPTLGLCGEAGEVAEKIKKILRDKEGIVSAEAVTAIVKELGDVLWYIAALCTELGVNMEEVAERNIQKLNARHEKGTLHGSGDDR